MPTVSEVASFIARLGRPEDGLSDPERIDPSSALQSLKGVRLPD